MSSSSGAENSSTAMPSADAPCTGRATAAPGKPMPADHPHPVVGPTRASAPADTHQPDIDADEDGRAHRKRASEASPSRPATRVSVTPKAITANWPASTVPAWRAMLGRSADWSVKGADGAWSCVGSMAALAAPGQQRCALVVFSMANGRRLIFSAMPAQSRPWVYRDH